MKAILTLVLAASASLHDNCPPQIVPVPSSFVTLYYNRSDCKHVDATGVSCTRARLVFEKVEIAKRCVIPVADDIVFIDENHKWKGTIHYSPKDCTVDGTVFECKGVSWRSAE